MVTGTSRLQRVLNYMDYLRHAIPGYEPSFTLFEGGHRPELWLASHHFSSHALNKTGYDVCLWDDTDCVSFLVLLVGCGCVCLVCGCIGGGTIYYCVVKRRQRAKSKDAQTLLLAQKEG